MGGKLMWTGLTFIMAKALLPIPAIEIVGALLMIGGCILMWFDK